MLQDILETKDFDFSSYIELEKYAKFLSRDDFHLINNILNDIFDKRFYLDVRCTLKTIGLSPVGDGPSKLIHGVYHVEKVFLYCFLMVKMHNMLAIDEERNEDIIPYSLAKLLYYAAFYHDIGRVDNSENSDHGLNSAKIFHENFIEHPDFKNNINAMYYTECLMTNHSEKYELDNSNVKNLIESVLYEHTEDWTNVEPVYNYANNFFILLCNILKDADALDRKRFGEWQRASLNENYLRTNYSKALINFADELNKLYYSIIKSKYFEPDFNKFLKGDGFHSIGFDFYKIRSILSNGILSQDKLKEKNIKVPRNFPGGNFDRWISVVDTGLYPDFVLYNERILKEKKALEDLISECGYSFESDGCSLGYEEVRYAAENFTHHGLTFVCCDLLFTNPEENKDTALENGMPWNKSNYVDEKYVYQEIKPNKIVGVFIPIECINSDIKCLRYIYESTNMDIVRDRINYYIRYTEVLYNDERIKLLDKLMEDYETLTINELSKETGCNSKEYFDESKRIITCINRIIGEFVYEFYKKELETPVFSIKDVVEHEIKKNDQIKFNAVNLKETTSKELFYSISYKKQLGNDFENNYKK